LRFHLPHFFTGAQGPDVVAAGQQFHFHIIGRHIRQRDAAQAIGQMLDDDFHVTVLAPEMLLHAMQGQHMAAVLAIHMVGGAIVDAGSEQQGSQNNQQLAHGAGFRSGYA
jgi:hypothetical protein